MGKVTVNLLVEIDGKTYKASNGMTVSTEVMQHDLENMATLGLRQIIAESGVRTAAQVISSRNIEAQDALIADE